MTDMIPPGQLIKTDEKGRVRTPRSRQEELLDEFERSGISGPKFAQISGIKYQTFATWVTRRRKERATAKPSQRKTSPVRWLEAVLDRAAGNAAASVPLVIHLPSGIRMEVGDSTQVSLAAQLLHLLEKGQPGPC
jgi:hypothetical protein